MLSLVPWMVTTAAAQDLPRAAQLIYSYKGPVSATFLRVGDECFAPLSSLKSFGWRSTLSGKEASIEAEGRILRLVVTQFNHQPMVPMRAAAEQLGAGCNWQKNKDTFEIWGSVRFATANDGEISVTSTLDAQPKLFLLSNPSRIVVDFKGARLDPNAKVELGALSRVAQFSDDTLRVVVETGSRPELNSDKASRNFTLKWDEAPAEPWTIELFDLYLLSDEKTLLFEDLVFKADPTPTTIIPASDCIVGPVSLVTEGKRSALLSIPISQSLPSAPTLRRVEPCILELRLPGTIAPVEQGGFDSRAIEKCEVLGDDTGVTIRITTINPMGIELSSRSNELQLLCLRPVVGDGKIAGKTIIVDAGHGGKDSGTKSATNILEKDLNLQIATLLSEKLADEGATVIMTRKTDEFIVLQERPEIANRNNADLFLSIHINSNGVSNSQSGTIIFYHAKETISNLLADCIGSEVRKLSALPCKGSWSDQRIYDTGFAVLRLSRMPGVLVETGFMNNQNDLKRMVSKDFQKNFAEAIVRGIKVFLGNGE